MNVETNHHKKQRKLITGNLKKLEQKVIDFYLEFGRKSSLNLKLIEIYAYFRIYDTLTQKQLKQLTGFSASTISAALQSFLQSGMLTRDFLPNTHTNIYTLLKMEYIYAYSANSNFYRKLEQSDLFIHDLQERSKDLLNKYPSLIKIFHKRLNGFRNYIEVQRRVFTGKSKNQFFSEDVSELISTDEYTHYPSELRKYEDEFVNYFVRNEMFIVNDPIINKILSYLTTRARINQEILLNLTGFSRSSISRNLVGYGTRGYVSISKKEYMKPRVYTIPIISLYLLDVVIRYNKRIFDWIPIFEESLVDLTTLNFKDQDSKFLLTKTIKRILEEIQFLKKNYLLLTEIQMELQNFQTKNG